MPITISGNGGISGLGDIDGHDLETATLVVSGDTTLGPQAVGRAALFIDDSANSVGINTTTPAAAVFLEVADATDPIVSLNNTGNGEVRLGCTSTLGYIGTNSNHPLNLRANNTNYLKIDTNGNIGLGALNTNYTLDITKNFTGENSVAIFNNINSGVVARASLKVGYDATAHLEIYRLGGAAPIYYDSKQSSSSHNFQIAGNGVFAITNSLPISATSNSTRYAEFNTTDSGSAYIGFQTQSTAYLDFGHNDRIYGNDAGEGDGGGINSRPGYSLTLGSANNCKVYFPGSSSAPLTLTSNCTGIDFSRISSTGTGTVSSNTLDDYEEGTWSPIFADAASGGNEAPSYGTQRGTYTKIGRLCHLSIDLRNFSTVGLTGSNQLFIRNLPFSIFGGSNSSIFVGTAELGRVNVESTCYGVAAFVNASSTNQNYVRIFEMLDSADHQAITVSDVNSGTNEIFITITVPVV